ncbi:MAG: ankyrin repeat domain-containing protein [Cyanobacteria bacterium]|nr:ankyrin repeat domain-containing protein [Cyanobacteriota bacterium]
MQGTRFVHLIPKPFFKTAIPERQDALGHHPMGSKNFINNRIQQDTVLFSGKVPHAQKILAHSEKGPRLVKEMKDLNQLGPYAETMLLKAIEHQDVDFLKQLLELHQPHAFVPQTKKPSKKIPTHNPPLIVAIENGEIEMAKMFILKGTDPNLRGVNNQTALHVAILDIANHLPIKEQCDFIQWLIEHGASVKAKEATQKETPLHWASVLGNKAVATILINKGADPNAEGSLRGKPLQLAAWGKHDALGKFLIEKGASPDDWSLRALQDSAVKNNDIDSLNYFHQELPHYIPIMAAIEGGNPDTLKTVLALAPIQELETVDPGKLLQHAIRNHRKDLIKLLIEAGCSLKTFPHIILWAVQQGDLPLTQSITQALQEKRGLTIDWFQKYPTDAELDPLTMALKLKNNDLFQWIWGQADLQLKNDAVVNRPITPDRPKSMEDYMNLHAQTTGKNILINALSTKETLPLVPWLIKKGMDPSIRNNNLENVLHILAKQGKDLPESLTLLPLFLEKGVDPYAEDPNHNTPLMLAIEDNDLETVKILLAESRIDINHQNSIGFAPIHTAVRYGNTELVDYLLKKGADINVRNNWGETPLHIASKGSDLVPKDKQNSLKMVQKLLSNPKIESNAKTNQLETALHIAANYNQKELVEYLLTQDFSVNDQDSRGFTPLHLASTESIPMLIKKGANLELQDKNGLTPLAYKALKNQIHTQNDKQLEYLLKAGANSNPKNFEGVSLMDALAPTNFSNTIGQLMEFGAKDTVFSKAIRDIWTGGTLAHDALVKIMPNLMLKHPVDFLNGHFKEIETFFDTNIPLRNYHPNEAELLLLLKHPDLIERDPQKTRALSTCLTSISHFIDIRAQLTDTTLKAWGEMGFLSHGFRFWRYDALGGENSLLAQFGFKPATEPRPFNEVYGKGFLYQDPTSASLIEFRRGYLLISHPDKGTLVIRNSSPAFGRNLLRHPAYYYKKALSQEEILSFDPRILTDEDSVLHRNHYLSSFNKNPDATHAMASLTDILLSVKEDYRRFKLDTKAFVQNGFGEKQFKGHLSPGLPKLVTILNQFNSKKMPLPDLAFSHPDFPIYQPYSFGEDAAGKAVSRFKLTPSSLKELNDFVSGQWSETKYPESDWIRFLQKAGVENRAELVMLEPENDP